MKYLLVKDLENSFKRHREEFNIGFIVSAFFREGKRKTLLLDSIDSYSGYVTEPLSDSFTIFSTVYYNNHNLHVRYAFKERSGITTHPYCTSEQTNHNQLDFVNFAYFFNLVNID